MPHELPKSQRSGLNRRPLDYESSALPLSYCGVPPAANRPLLRSPSPCPGTDSNRDALRHHPLKMACLPISPPGPTIPHFRRASFSAIGVQNSQMQELVLCDNRQLSNTGATGFEPATSRVTVECSNQAELRPQLNPIAIDQKFPGPCSVEPSPTFTGSP